MTPFYARPLSKEFEKYGISYWIDEAEIKWGDRITEKIDNGLANSRYVLVLLTVDFLQRNWPQAELNSALNLEASSGETVVLPILIAQSHEVFKKYPLLRDKHYLEWGIDEDTIALRLLELLGRNFKESWVYCHPAEYSGIVWIRFVINPEKQSQLHHYKLRWGPWEHNGSLSFEESPSVTLLHAKGNDGLSIPLFCEVRPSCYVSFGQDNPPAGRRIDINYGWQRVE